MSETPQTFDKLYRCLREQTEIIDRLLDLGGDQFRAVRGNDLAGLVKIVGEQETLAARLAKAEEERLLLLASLESLPGVEKGTTAAALLSHAPQTLQSSLEEAFREMRNKVRKLKEINSLNAAVIKKILRLNSRLLQIMSAGAPKTYGLKGEIREEPNFASVLNKSV